MSLLPPLLGTVLSFKGGINVSVRCKHTTAREGNVFRSMCHSVHRGVSVQSPEAKSLSGGGHLVAVTAVVGTLPTGMHSSFVLFLCVCPPGGVRSVDSGHMSNGSGSGGGR